MARDKQKPMNSWRNIQQKFQGGRVTTKVAKQRQLVILFRGAFVILLIVAIATGIVAIRYFGEMVKEEPRQSVTGITQIDFSTDGVLTKDWFNAAFPEIIRTDIRDINVQNLKERLAAKGQVKQAEVTVQLPSALKIQLQEREPILRMRLRDSSGNPMTLLVARDGNLYKGYNYPQDTLIRLPGVTGLRVKRTNYGYLPITGLEPVAELLDLAQEKLPAMFRHWQLVDLTDWNPEVDYRPSLIKIASSHIQEIVFSTYSLNEQIAQLGGILQRIDRYQMGQPKSIDLSFGDEAVIRWE